MRVTLLLLVSLLLSLATCEETATNAFPLPALGPVIIDHLYASADNSVLLCGHYDIFRTEMPHFFAARFFDSLVLPFVATAVNYERCHGLLEVGSTALAVVSFDAAELRLPSVVDVTNEAIVSVLDLNLAQHFELVRLLNRNLADELKVLRVVAVQKKLWVYGSFKGSAKFSDGSVHHAVSKSFFLVFNPVSKEIETLEIVPFERTADNPPVIFDDYGEPFAIFSRVKSKEIRVVSIKSYDKNSYTIPLDVAVDSAVVVGEELIVAGIARSAFACGSNTPAVAGDAVVFRTHFSRVDWCVRISSPNGLVRSLQIAIHPTQGSNVWLTGTYSGIQLIGGNFRIIERYPSVSSFVGAIEATSGVLTNLYHSSSPYVITTASALVPLSGDTALFAGAYHAVINRHVMLINESAIVSQASTFPYIFRLTIEDPELTPTPTNIPPQKSAAQTARPVTIEFTPVRPAATNSKPTPPVQLNPQYDVL